MASTRLRLLSSLVPTIVLAGLVVASPSLAAPWLQVSAPLAGQTVTGEFVVSGDVGGDSQSAVSIALAPQTFDSCGAPSYTVSAELVGTAFSVSIPNRSVADGTYCVVVIADDGRLSTAVGNVVVASVIDDSTTLPTLSLAETAATDLAFWPLADATALAPIVLGAAASLALIVLVLGHVQRRRRDS